MTWCLFLLLLVQLVRAIGNQNISSRVCIVAIIFEEDLYIQEWIDYHVNILRFDHIYLYDNTDNFDSQYLAWVHPKEALSIEHMPGKLMMGPAHNDFLSKHKNSDMWAFFIDIDEFIILRQHRFIQEFVADYAVYGGSVSLNWVIFGSNGHLSYSLETVMSRFTSRSASVSPYVKSMVYLPHSRVVNSPHSVDLIEGQFHRDTHGNIIELELKAWNFKGDVEIAAINHYHTKSLGEFNKKRMRGKADAIDKYDMNHFVEFDQNEVEDISQWTWMIPDIIDYNTASFLQESLALLEAVTMRGEFPSISNPVDFSLSIDC
jgi:hypothetical protein